MYPEDGDRTFLRNVGTYLSTRLHVTCQKTVTSHILLRTSLTSDDPVTLRATPWFVFPVGGGGAARKFAYEAVCCRSLLNAFVFRLDE